MSSAAKTEVKLVAKKLIDRKITANFMELFNYFEP